MDHVELAEKLNQISSILDGGKDLISSEKIAEFQNSATDIENRLEGIMKESRLLRLGIVGEVKAGKSSFLNALLFDGKDVLPKAPTPMTAALTRIKYSDVPQVKVVFYNQNDWDIVNANAKRYDETLERMYREYSTKYDEMEKERQKTLLKKENKETADTAAITKKKTKAEFEKEIKDSLSIEYSSCKELIDMATKNGLNVSAYLGREEIVSGNASDGDSFLKKLDQYVGANGKFTSIVKYTELQMNNPMLEGIEVIDTPGLNDPIRSRGRTTRNFLLECDAVFLLGYCGQFLGADDMSLILSSLPDEGIKKAVLIGSKLDSAILQYPKTSSFTEAYLGTIRNCAAQARENLEECNVNSKNEQLITQLKKSLPPMCVSSVAYSAGRQMQNNESFGPLEQWLANTYKNRYSDFTLNVETLLGLSNIPDVKESVFNATKAEKEAIISERISSLISSQKGKFLGILEDIAIQVKNNQNDLKKYDLEQLEDKLENMKERLDSVRVVVRTLFQNAGADSRRTIEDVVVDIGLEMKNHTDIEVTTSKRTEHHSSTSGHLWWKTTERWDEIITTNIAQAADVEANIKDYYFSCLQMINDIFKNLLKIDQLKNSVKSAVLAAFDQNDKDFDENRIILPLESSLNRITIPQAETNTQKYIELLDSMTVNIIDRGAVKNENIPELKKAQDRVFSAISNDIIDYLRNEALNIDSKLQNESATFIDDIVAQLEGNMGKVRDLLHNKQESLQKFDEFNEKIKECKSIIQQG